MLRDISLDIRYDAATLFATLFDGAIFAIADAAYAARYAIGMLLYYFAADDIHIRYFRRFTLIVAATKMLCRYGYAPCCCFSAGVAFSPLLTLRRFFSLRLYSPMPLLLPARFAARTI